MFYKAIVQSVLLYGSETWAVTPQMLKILDSFHHRIARRITNTMPKQIANGEWKYTPVEKALDGAGLHTIDHYIRHRQNTVAVNVVNRPIHTLCKQADEATSATSPGSRSRLWWWAQSTCQPLAEEPPMDLGLKIKSLTSLENFDPNLP